MPVVATTIEETRHGVAAARQAGKRIGLVPTMGALHAGHASLLKAARAETGFVVASIFVNPTQFGPHEDLSRYPRPFEADVALCEREGVDLIFHPAPPILYPAEFKTFVEVSDLQDRWEGASRPGHFRGVATIVLKLFNIVQPDVAYFGQKDFQQARLIERMACDLDVPLALKICPTVREPDGLALSSRNQYLNAEERRRAGVLFQALDAVQRRVAQGERETAPLAALAEELVWQTPGARLDYAAIVDPVSLRPVERIAGPVQMLLAVYIGSTRLIDNMTLKP
ncbi:MAG: pantoate--beta-alanine ligase [Gemmataceae bacterium]